MNKINFVEARRSFYMFLCDWCVGTSLLPSKNIIAIMMYYTEKAAALHAYW